MGPYREQEIVEILNSNEPESLASLLQAAHNTRIRHLGNEVYLRGLIEFSNYCPRNCLYCGLRKSNENIHRYRLDEDKIIELAMMAYDMGFQSIALQSGEIDSQEQVDFLAAIVEKIILSSRQRGQQGLGVTLSMGELSYQQYLQLWQAGAHRYLLRIETSNPQLFKNIHPPSQLYHRRLECPDALKDIGYQVGTGIMVGLPGQSNEQLAQDLAFFQKRDIDMLGLGPYIPHSDTPLARVPDRHERDAFTLTLKMLALARLTMPDINMVASTALQSINPLGLRWGLMAGANIIMPVLTPEEKRRDYSLYDNKEQKSMEEIAAEVAAGGFKLGYWKWGDSPHYFRRREQPLKQV